MTRVLVCGGRRYNDATTIAYELGRIPVIEVLIHGNAGKRIDRDGRTQIIGADRLAGLWALHHGIKVMEFNADWKRDGRAAGPIRNQRMLERGTPDLVVAFSGGTGTADMVRRATDAGVRVIIVEPREDKELVSSVS